jgi:hypothetical protein
MKTWKSKRTVCRSAKSGRFVRKKKCGQFIRQRIKAPHLAGLLFR